jgi:hypothetical protein
MQPPVPSSVISPQAFTHVGLINAAVVLEACRAPTARDLRMGAERRVEDDEVAR